jgi:parvulin-like peptidyl-prolyl isomerase
MEKVFVNDVEISQDAIMFELDRLIRFYASHGMSQAELTSNMERLREKAVDQAIGAKLLFLRAEQLDVKVTGEEIDAEVEKVKTQIGGEEAYKNALAAQKITEEDFRKELEKGARVNKLVEQACTGVEEPTDAQVASFYEAHKSEYVEPEQVLCRHILVKGSDDAALDKIKEIRERILAGASFEEEAKKHSDCPSGANGGSLGWFGRGMMVPEFDKAAFDMAKGEVSSVILTQFGYHIIYKDDEKKESSLTLVDVHDQIKDLLRHNARGAAMDAFVAELRANAKIERK